MSEEEGRGWRAPGGPPSPHHPPRQDITPDQAPGGADRSASSASPDPGTPPAAPWSPPTPPTAPPGWAAPDAAGAPPGAQGTPPGPPPNWAPPGAPGPAPVAPQGWQPPGVPGAPPGGPAAGPVAGNTAVLRPQTLGDLLNGGFAYLRDNPRTVFGLSFVVVALTSVLPALGLGDVFSGYAELLRSETPSPRALGMSGMGSAAFYVGLLLQYVGNWLLLGLLSTVVAAAALGRRTSPREALAALRGRWGALLALVGFYLVFFVVAMVVLALVLAVAIAVTVAAPLAGLPLLALGLVGYIALFGWLVVRTSLAVPAAVLERVGPGRALVRSWQLSTGSFWRMVGVLLLANLLVSVIANILSTPFSVGAVIISAVASDMSLASLVGVMLSFIGMLVTGCISQPFTAGITTLLYLDLRVRREGLDLRLREAARSGVPVGPELLAAPAPGGAV